MKRLNARLLFIVSALTLTLAVTGCRPDGKTTDPTSEGIVPTPTSTELATATTPTEQRTWIPPVLSSISPSSGRPGTMVEVRGYGGYYLITSGESRIYDEQARPMKLLFEDGIGHSWEIDGTCYVNICIAIFEVPESTVPGVHMVKPLDGGDMLSFTVTEPLPRPMLVP